MIVRYRDAAGVLAILTLVAASGLDAQVRRGRAPAEGPGWAPASIGIHVGYDQNANGEVLGAHLRVPILPNGRVELLTNWDAVFVTRAKEYQYNLELVYVTGGRALGPYLGGGMGYRHTVFGTTAGDSRNKIFAYTAVAGVASTIGKVRTQLELRWIFLNDAALRPIPVSLGVSLPLWRTAPAGS